MGEDCSTCGQQMGQRGYKPVAYTSRCINPECPDYGTNPASRAEPASRCPACDKPGMPVKSTRTTLHPSRTRATWKGTIRRCTTDGCRVHSYDTKGVRRYEDGKTPTDRRWIR